MPQRTDTIASRSPPAARIISQRAPPERTSCHFATNRQAAAAAWRHIFLDGARLSTPALSEAVDRLARHIDGFHFGRFDVRSSSVEAFAAGHFAVIELNGVTSEATSIYDPQNSLWSAYRTLCAQWRLAFEIGTANVARGVPATPLMTLVTLVRGYAQRLRTRTDRERQLLRPSYSGVRFGHTAR